MGGMGDRENHPAQDAGMRAVQKAQDIRNSRYAQGSAADGVDAETTGCKRALEKTAAPERVRESGASRERGEALSDGTDCMRPTGCETVSHGAQAASPGRPRRMRAAFAAFDARCLRAAAGLMLLLLSSSTMNAAVFPLFDGVFTYARDISALANAAFLAAVGLIAAFAPARLHAPSLSRATAASFVFGGVFLVAALVFDNAPLLVASSCVLAAARGWAALCAGLAASRLPSARIVPTVMAAFTAYCLIDAALWFAPAFAGIAAFLLCAPVAWALTWRDARTIFQEASSREAPVDVAITQPSSFLPLAGAFFVCLLLFRVAFGYSLRFFEHAGAPLPGFVGVVPVVLLAAAAVALTRGRLLADLAMRVSVLFVVAGFFAAAALGEGSAGASVALLSAGNTLFDMVAWIVLISVAGRNAAGAVAVVAWGRGISGVGTIAGAALGVWSTQVFGQNAHAAVLLAGVLILVFVGYALIGLQDFSFASAIEGVVPAVEEAAAEAKTPEEEFDERCAALAERFGLSPREREVFSMLARGRNREYIQEQLVVSRNTVKAHVKHVYAKLGIHTHQELIDLVEEDGA